MIHTNSRDVGNRYENIAVEYLKKQDYVILDQNYHCRFGEIDIIAKASDQTIVFIEVKFRHSTVFGHALESVSPTKREKIRKTSLFYITEKHLQWNQMYRFDVIVFQNDRMEHIVDAFY